MPLQRLYTLAIFKANNSNEDVCDDREGDDETEADEGAECAKLLGLRGLRGLEKLCWSWAVGRGTWVTLRGSWVNLRGSWVLFTDNFA